MILLVFSRLPRLLAFAVVGLILGISKETDEFFLPYSTTMFLTGISIISGEILGPSKQLLKYISITSVVLLLCLAFYTESILPLEFIPLTLLTTYSSILTGVNNRKQNYFVTLKSTLPYLIAFVALYPLSILIGIHAIIVLFTISEFVRFVVLQKQPLQIPETLDRHSIYLILSPALIGIMSLITVLFASTMEHGEITVIIYSVGFTSALTTLVVYGLTIKVINGLEVKPIKYYIGGLGLVGLLAIVLEVHKALQLHWTSDIVDSLMIVSILIPFRLVAATVYPKIVVHKQNYGTYLVSAIVMVIALSVLIYPLSSLGVNGLLWSLVISESLGIVFLWIKYESISRKDLRSSILSSSSISNT